MVADDVPDDRRPRGTIPTSRHALPRLRPENGRRSRRTVRPAPVAAPDPSEGIPRPAREIRRVLASEFPVPGCGLDARPVRRDAARQASATSRERLEGSARLLVMERHGRVRTAFGPRSFLAVSNTRPPASGPSDSRPSGRGYRETSPPWSLPGHSPQTTVPRSLHAVQKEEEIISGYSQNPRDALQRG